MSLISYLCSFFNIMHLLALHFFQVTNTIGSIVRKFVARQPMGSREIKDPHIFAIMTCQYSTQPMFLRSLLQSLQLTLSFTSVTTEILIEKFLACTTAHQVIETSINICYNALMAHETDDHVKYTPLVNSRKKASMTQHANNDHNKENTHNDVPLGAARADLHHVDHHINYREIVANVFSMVYISRNGLTLDEIWGAVFSYMKIKPEEVIKHKVLPILTNFTMVVENMHSFSHEVYREVVYSNYIKSKDAVVKLHLSLARFFTQLPPCDRKLVVLPYHLEAAGSWSKVKNCLTDIELFQKWWRNPKSKVDFIKFWVSLTSFDKTEKLEKGKRSHQSYDIVDEYVKSLDEYRISKEPPDEELSNIILEIGDFLLEFATLGHEKNCDVPNFFHPQIPTNDLKNVGVPYLCADKFGRSVMAYPDVIDSLHKNQNVEDDGREDGDSNRLLADIPICTSYFFQRWMWIQYPYIALGNCDARYTRGVDQHIQETKDYSPVKQPQHHGNGLTQETLIELRKKINSAPASNTTFNANSFKLPELSFRRKAARSFRRVPADNGVDATVVGVDKVAQRLIALQDDILNHKEEHDFVVQMKTAKEKKLYQLKGIMVDLQRSGESSAETAHAVAEAQRLEQDADQKVKSVTRLYTNLQKLQVMCNRHPANVPALLEELQIKIDTDKFLLAEIKKRIFEQIFEKQMHDVYFKQMKLLVEEGLQMHNKLLTYRYMMKKDIQIQQIDMEKRLNKDKTEQENNLLLSNGPSNKKMMNDSFSLFQIRSIEEGGSIDSFMSVSGKDWKDQWNMISSRTGIIEPEVFFDRINNGKILEDQISSLRKASEARLEHLKKEFIEVESELQDISGAIQNSGLDNNNYEAEKTKVSSADAHDNKELATRVNVKDKKKELDDKIASMKRLKENTESAEQIRQKIESGLIHIAGMVGIPSIPEEDCVATQLLNEIESMLETLLNESERHMQQMLISSQSASSSSLEGGGMFSPMKPLSPEKQQDSTHRIPELDYIIAKYEDPKARLPKCLPSRSQDIENEKQPSKIAEYHDDSFDDDLIDRHYIKSSASKVLRTEEKKQEKMLKDKEKEKTRE